MKDVDADEIARNVQALKLQAGSPRIRGKKSRSNKASPAPSPSIEDE